VSEHTPWIVVGLGNPGPEYAATRHNVGAMVAAVLAERTGGRFATHKRARAEVVEGRLAGQRAVIARPRSYMNESGGPVSALLAFYKTPLDRLVVLHDELDIPFAALRLKDGGGDNGHNGLKSIRRSLGSGDFLRERIGIGRPPGRQDPADFVLRAFSGPERTELPFLLDRAADAVESLITEGLQRAQTIFNADPAEGAPR
jgi:peptidyl-tRNA hydrolase, PTH1 family